MYGYGIWPERERKMRTNGEGKRRKSVTAAAELFVELGYERTSMSAIRWCEPRGAEPPFPTGNIGQGALPSPPLPSPSLPLHAALALLEFPPLESGLQERSWIFSHFLKRIKNFRAVRWVILVVREVRRSRMRFRLGWIA